MKTNKQEVVSALTNDFMEMYMDGDSPIDAPVVFEIRDYLKQALQTAYEAGRGESDDLLDDMWGLICNVNGGIVEDERHEWYEAFKRIRAKYLTPTNTDKQTDITSDK